MLVVPMPLTLTPKFSSCIRPLHYMAHAIAFAVIRTTKTREHFVESSYTTQL